MQKYEPCSSKKGVGIRKIPPCLLPIYVHLRILQRHGVIFPLEFTGYAIVKWILSEECFLKYYDRLKS